jgi:hypothetical protein
MNISRLTLKILSTVGVAITALSFLFVLSLQVQHSLANDDAAAGQSPGASIAQQEKPNICALVRTNIGLSQDPEEDTVDKPCEKSEEIIVGLTESFTKVYTDSSEKVSAGCSQIYECIRGAKKSNVCYTLNTMKDKYPKCVVVGRTGLDILKNYVSTIYTWVAGLVGVVCILIIIFSGIQISMGGVSPDEVTAAKDRILRSIFGIIVLFLSAFILYSINPIFFG